MSLHIHTFTFNGFQENTYVLYNNEKEAIIVDPGCYSKAEQIELETFISKKQLKVLALWNTHAHIDHVLGNYFVKTKYQVPYYLHEKDLVTLQAVANYAHLYGFEGYQISPEPNVFFNDFETLTLGSFTFDVIFAPGHAPGHVVFHHKESKQLIAGDVLFKGSFGRVDLPGGDLNTLKESIYTKLFPLDDETIVYPGHGDSTTIGVEKRTNYILQF